MKPRLLLVEDDPVSARFLAEALESLPAQVELADSLAGALATNGAFDLALIDANLPDGTGLQLLQALRARGEGARAIAHTADDSRRAHEFLLQGGFEEVLLKPLGADDLRRAVSRHLLPSRVRDAAASPSAPSHAPLWDHAHALAALNGNATNAATLRAMFLEELPRQHASIVAAFAAGDAALAARQLHQLKASSGFVGALRVRAAAAALERAPDAATIESLSDSVRDTLASAPSSDA